MKRRGIRPANVAGLGERAFARKSHVTAISIAVAVLLHLFAGNRPSSAQVYSRTVIMSGLDNPHGLTWGPDGGLYVAESGRGGDGPSMPGPGGELYYFGTSGAVSRWKDGLHQRVLTGLPSVALANGGNASGLRDLVFPDDGTLVGLFGSAGMGDLSGRDSLGPDAANLGRIVSLPLDGSGSVTPIADLVAFEDSTNPDNGLIQSNPFRFTPAAEGGFAVVDAAGNSLLGVTDDGVVSAWTAFGRLSNPLPFGPPQIDSVPTSVALGTNGVYYISELTGVPYPPGEAKIYRYDAEHDDLQVAITGFTNLVDIAFDEEGYLYALQISSNGLASPQGPGSGVLWQIDPASGDRTMIASDGLMSPTAVLPGPDGSLYVSNFGTSAVNGQVLRLAPVPEPGSVALLVVAALGLPQVRKSRAGIAKRKTPAEVNTTNAGNRNILARGGGARRSALCERSCRGKAVLHGTSVQMARLRGRQQSRPTSRRRPIKLVATSSASAQRSRAYFLLVFRVLAQSQRLVNCRQKNASQGTVCEE